MISTKKGEELLDQMERYGTEDICLGFSGGVDSSLLLKLACDSTKRHGKKVWAVTFDTMLHPSCDLENAKRVAEELDALHMVLKVDELEQEEIRYNPVNRCYLCKYNLFSALKQFAQSHGCRLVMDGTNEDDLHVYRPGIQALRELGIISPLADCGYTKEEVKELAKSFGISAASRPSTPCMATRLPYGAEIRYELLERIEKGEAFLREQLGGEKWAGNVRLRIHGDIARIEADKEQFVNLLSKREEVIWGLKDLGFTYITLDLEGFRSGSMDVHILKEMDS